MTKKGFFFFLLSVTFANLFHPNKFSKASKQNKPSRKREACQSHKIIKGYYIIHESIRDFSHTLVACIFHKGNPDNAFISLSTSYPTVMEIYPNRSQKEAQKKKFGN